MSTAVPSAKGNYLPQQINFIKDIGPEHKKFLEDAAMMINRKDTGQYDLNEHIINQEYFGATPQKTRSIYRKVIECGTLPNAGTTTTAHNIIGIGNNWMMTRIYGTAREPAGAGLRPFFIPLPNGGVGRPVEIMVDQTNIYLTSAVNLAAFTYSIVILEYFKLG